MTWDRYRYNYHVGAFDESILMLAAIAGDEKIIEKILRQISNTKRDKSCAKRASIHEGHEAAMSALCPTGFEIDSMDLCLAAERGNHVMVNRIVQTLQERVISYEKLRWWERSRMGTR